MSAFAICTRSGFRKEPARDILVDLTFCALLSLRGQQPAHETRCFDVGNTDMSAPISESIRIAVKGSLDNPGTVLIRSRVVEYGLASLNISVSSLSIRIFCSSIKSRHIFSFVACSGQIAPSTAACISSIGCLQSLCIKGATSNVSSGCSRICVIMEREDLPNTSENTSSRGCMYNCAFCGGARSLNRDIPIRIRSTESIVSEIRDIISLYPDVKCIRILDDLFLRDGKSIDMANKIFSEFPQLSWRGMVHVLSLINNITKADELPQSHCRELFIGIESGSERVRRHINKRGTKQEILEVASAILKNNIDLKGYFIYGFPDKTEEDFKETYDLALRIKEISMKTGGQFRTSVFQFRPYHGTELYFEIEKKGGIMHPCVFNQSISQFEGRSQFNFSFGNYSLEPDNLLFNLSRFFNFSVYFIDYGSIRSDKYIRANKRRKAHQHFGFLFLAAQAGPLVYI